MGIYNRTTKQLESLYSVQKYTLVKLKPIIIQTLRGWNMGGWDFESWLLDLFSREPKLLYQLALQLLHACIRESLGKMFWFILEKVEQGKGHPRAL